jgi:hypothetical protein
MAWFVGCWDRVEKIYNTQIRHNAVWKNIKLKVNWVHLKVALALQNNTAEYKQFCQLQWPRGLKHELSSSAQTLESWIQIPL